MSVLDRPTPVAQSAILLRVFVGFLPISDTDRATCGVCGGPSSGPPEPVGNGGLVVFTCRGCRLFDYGEE